MMFDKTRIRYRCSNRECAHYRHVTNMGEQAESCNTCGILGFREIVKTSDGEIDMTAISDDLLESLEPFFSKSDVFKEV